MENIWSEVFSGSPVLHLWELESIYVSVLDPLTDMHSGLDKIAYCTITRTWQEYKNSKQVGFARYALSLLSMFFCDQHIDAGGIDPEWKRHNRHNTKRCRKNIIFIQVKNFAANCRRYSKEQGDKGKDRFHNARFRYVKK